MTIPLQRVYLRPIKAAAVMRNKPCRPIGPNLGNQIAPEPSCAIIVEYHHHLHTLHLVLSESPNQSSRLQNAFSPGKERQGLRSTYLDVWIPIPAGAFAHVPQ